MSDAARGSAPTARRRLTLVGGPLAGVRVPGLAVAALVLLVFAVLSLAPQVSTYLATQQQLKDTQAKVAAQQRDLMSLDQQVARWNDPAYIRSQAGSRLFYVMPGETTYRVVGLPATGSTGSSTRTAAQQQSPDWFAGLLDSVVTAGTTESTHPTTAANGG